MLGQEQLYAKILYSLLSIFQYNKNNIKFVSLFYMSDHSETSKRIENKTKINITDLNIGFGFSALSNLGDLMKKKENEEEEADDVE